MWSHLGSQGEGLGVPRNTSPAGPMPRETIVEAGASFRRATVTNERFFQDLYADLLARNPVYVRVFGNVEMVQPYARLYASIHKFFGCAENPRSETLYFIAAIHKTKTLSFDTCRTRQD